MRHCSDAICNTCARLLVWTCVIVVMPSVIHVLDYCGALALGRVSVMFSIFGHLACWCHGRKINIYATVERADVAQISRFFFSVLFSLSPSWFLARVVLLAFSLLPLALFTPLNQLSCV